LPDEKEALILDIAFPSNNVIESNRRVYLVLHGINGDSHEGYVADFVDRQVRQGDVVAVLVTRGLGESPILGENIVHFARTKDVEAAARALKSAIREVSNGDEAPLLSGVGYSMGAITLGNYVATSGAQCELDAAVSISGALDTREQVKFPRSASLWQPFITKAIRDTLLSSFGNKIRNKLTPEQLKESIKAASLVDFDRAFFVPYHNFDSLEDYYSRLGAMGDFVSFDDRDSQGRIANVSIPLLCVYSLDDPIGYWGVYRDPEKVVHTGDGNTVLLFTKRGGHVGWPLGINPSLKAWQWMSDVASSFAEAVDIARKEGFKHSDKC
jgi:predicted alpha/beta-fold hydrolase